MLLAKPQAGARGQDGRLPPSFILDPSSLVSFPFRPPPSALWKTDNEIASLEALLNSGAERTEVDGVSVRFNIDAPASGYASLSASATAGPRYCKGRAPLRRLRRLLKGI